MSDLPSRKDLFRVGRRTIVTTPNTRINPNVVDTPGSDIGLVLGACSVMGEEVVTALANCLQGLFVETARADQLDRIAFDRYGLTRFPAVPATATVTFARTGAGAAGTIPAGNRIQTSDGTVFAIDIDVICPAGVFSIDVNATALLTGPDGNVPVDSLVQFVDQAFDNTITVTNGFPAAGGSDTETDAVFRGRILGFFPTIRRGTLGAIEFGALQVPGVVVSRAFEITNGFVDGEPVPACAVQLIIGDINGIASATMISQVKQILLQYRAAGIPVEVLTGIPFNVNVQWQVAFEASIDTVNASTQLRAVTVAVAQFLRPGETLFRSSLIAAARTIPGVIVSDASLIAPAGDLVLLPTENNRMIRIDSQDVVINA